MSILVKVIAGLEEQKNMYGGMPCSKEMLTNMLADAISEAIPTIRGLPLEKLFKNYAPLVGIEPEYISAQDIKSMHKRIAELDHHLELQRLDQENHLLYLSRH